MRPIWKIIGPNGLIIFFYFIQAECGSFLLALCGLAWERTRRRDWRERRPVGVNCTVNCIALRPLRAIEQLHVDRDNSRAGRFVHGTADLCLPTLLFLRTPSPHPPMTARNYIASTPSDPLSLFLSFSTPAFPADHLVGGHTPINNEYMNMKIFMRIYRCMYALWLRTGTSNKRSSDTTALHSVASSRIASICVSGSCTDRNL